MRRIKLVLAVAVATAATLGFLGVASAKDNATTGTTAPDNTVATESTPQASSNDLVLEEIKPPNGATDVAKDTSVKATFNKNLDASTVRNNFSLKDTDTDKTVNASITVDGDVAKLNPNQNLKSGDHYKAKLSGGLRSKSGDKLKSVNGSGADFDSSTRKATWTFTVES